MAAETSFGRDASHDASAMAATSAAKHFAAVQLARLKANFMIYSSLNISTQKA
jgi:hypothetical protein